MPIYSPEGPPSGFIWGQLSPVKSRVTGVFNYEENTDFEVEYVIESAPLMNMSQKMSRIQEM